MLPVPAGGSICRVLKRSSDGWIRPHSTHAGGSAYSVASILRFDFCNATVYDPTRAVRRLRELPLQWRKPRTHPGPHCVLGHSCHLAAWSACRRFSSTGSSTPHCACLYRIVHANPRKGSRRLPCGNASSRLCRHQSKGQAALQEAVNVSLLCTSILRHWREPFSLLQLCALGETAPPPRALPSARSSRGSFSLSSIHRR